MESYTEPYWIIFTDLDGTLLDHDTYDFRPAAQALSRVKQHKIPLIISSSKTFAEILPLRKTLDISDPFIAENGSLIAIPDGYFTNKPNPESAPEKEIVSGMELIRLGGHRGQIVDLLNSLRTDKGFRFRGFSDMSDNELSKQTGLTIDQAKLANQRLCTEPIIWEDSDTAWSKFSYTLKKHGYHWVQGGRFISISKPFDKKDGIIKIIQGFKAAGHHHIKTIGLGDSPNDLGMLEMMDIAVVIRSKRSEMMKPELPDTIIRTRQSGPAGWQESMDKLFAHYKMKNRTD